VTQPQRIQRLRKKGWRKPDGAVIVTRPGKYGNPYRVGVDGTAEECVEKYRLELERARRIDPKGFEAWIAPLRGHDLCCFCPLTDKDGNPVPCHASILLQFANEVGT